MEPAVERELVLPASPEEVWESLAEPEWLGAGAHVELRPAGEVRAGSRTGFVEWADAPRGLAFWWSEEGEEATRVEIAPRGGRGGHARERDRVAPARAAGRGGERPPSGPRSRAARHA